MAGSYRRQRPVAVALVVEDDLGNRQLVWSKDLTQASIEYQMPRYSGYLSDEYDRPHFQIEKPPKITINVEMQSATIVIANEIAEPAAIQSGVYLPDMSYALAGERKLITG